MTVRVVLLFGLRLGGIGRMRPVDIDPFVDWLGNVVALAVYQPLKSGQLIKLII